MPTTTSLRKLHLDHDMCAGFQGTFIPGCADVNRHGSQTAGHLQEDHVTRISRTVQLISQFLPDTLR
jgi:hypothetical protein